ncbi:MAG TPA: Ku protein [Candidatus Angelobacter sp.]|nr:Ku protein [Candidatus Angelobacter sp.]
MASTVWKGYFSFGLISVPIRLYAAARELHVSFHQIHAVCGTRIKQQLYCPHCERVVERSELAKGYPIEGGGNVEVTNEELRSLEAASSETMEIVQFVKLNDVDPLYFQTSYYTVAETAGQRAYTLIFQGMEHLKVGAIAKITLHQREQIVMLRPYDKGIVLHTLYYAAEVREVAEYGNQPLASVQKAEVELAEQFMKQLTAEFDPSQFKDEYQARVEALVEQKAAGAEIAVEKPRKKPPAKVINLMDALKESMARHAGEAKGKGAAVEIPAKKPSRRAEAGARRKAG